LTFLGKGKLFIIVQAWVLFSSRSENVTHKQERRVAETHHWAVDAKRHLPETKKIK
jgi:hypothetical protein